MSSTVYAHHMSDKARDLMVAALEKATPGDLDRHWLYVEATPPDFWYEIDSELAVHLPGLDQEQREYVAANIVLRLNREFMLDGDPKSDEKPAQTWEIVLDDDDHQTIQADSFSWDAGLLMFRRGDKDVAVFQASRIKYARVVDDQPATG